MRKKKKETKKETFPIQPLTICRAPSLPRIPRWVGLGLRSRRLRKIEKTPDFLGAPFSIGGKDVALSAPSELHVMPSSPVVVPPPPALLALRVEVRDTVGRRCRPLVVVAGWDPFVLPGDGVGGGDCKGGGRAVEDDGIAMGGTAGTAGTPDTPGTTVFAPLEDTVDSSFVDLLVSTFRLESTRLTGSSGARLVDRSAGDVDRGVDCGMNLGEPWDPFGGKESSPLGGSPVVAAGLSLDTVV